MNKKIVRINGKTYVVDLDTKKMEEVEEDKIVEETKDDEEPKDDEESKDDEADDEDKGLDIKVDEAAKKIMKSLGVDELKDEIKNLSKTVNTKENKKVSALIDFEKLMKKDVSEMTADEKIIGFFQGMIQSNHAVLKALSEGTAADGGYLFPKLKFIGELKLGELLENPNRTISSQALPVMA